MGHPYGAIRGLVVATLGAALVIIVSYVFIVAAASVGPNCPDKDPTWRGWCSEAPSAT